MTKRKFVHISMIIFALLVGWLPPYVISLVCLAAIIFNVFIMPALTSHSLESAEDARRGYSTGIIAYPVILFILSLIFYNQQVFLVIGWGALAFGDGFASVIGRAYGRNIVKNGNGKTWEGFAAFVIAGSIFTCIFLFLLPVESRYGQDPWLWFIIVFLSVLIAAILELTISEVNDNIFIPAVAAFVAWLMYLSVENGSYVFPEKWLSGGIVLILFGVLSLLSGKISHRGLVTGMFISLLFFLGGGLMGLIMLIVFFFSGSLVSMIGLKRKRESGLVQENKGKRTSAHAIANAGVAAICAYCAWSFPASSMQYIMLMSAAIASASSDTFSSEIGNVLGSKFVNILTFKPDTRGKDGVVSIEGSLAGLLGSLVIALIYFLFTRDINHSLIIMIAGFCGNIIDSILGASAERKGLLGNHSVNFISSLGATGIAFLLI